MTNSPSSKIYEHYLRYLGNPRSQLTPNGRSANKSIQAFIFDEPIEDAFVVATLGVSMVQPKVGQFEVACIVDESPDLIADCLLHGLFQYFSTGIEFGYGCAIAGIEIQYPSLNSRWNKSGFFFAHFWDNVPDAFRTIDVPDSIEILYALPITASEYDYFDRFGAGKLEAAFEAADVDPVSLSRKSIF